jgi:hypothetical protein
MGLHEIENEIPGVKRSLLQKKNSMFSERWECIENTELVSCDAVQFVLHVSVERADCIPSVSKYHSFKGAHNHRLQLRLGGYHCFEIRWVPLLRKNQFNPPSG